MLVKKHDKLHLTYRQNHLKLPIIIFVFFLAGTVSLISGTYSDINAAQVTLAWDRTDSDLAGYNLYFARCQLDENCTTANRDKGSLENWQIEIDGLQNPNAPQITLHNLSDIHKYAFTLTAYDATGRESDFSNEVNFTPPNSSSQNSVAPSSEQDTSANQPPKVNAGRNKSVAVGKKTTLSGSVSDDDRPESSEIEHKWYQAEGPGTAEFDDASSLRASVSFDKAGNYTLVLEANDGQLKASDSVTIEVYEDSASDNSNNGNPGNDSSQLGTEEQAIIIDNDDKNNTSSEGTWQQSDATSCYGKDSIVGTRGASFVYHFLSPATGIYDLSIWWTQHRSRSNIVPISIESEDGVKQVSINQRNNGGQWASLGKYKFMAGESYEIKITARKVFRTTSVDAVKFLYLGANEEEIQTEYDPSDENVIYSGCGSNLGGFR